MKVLVTADAGSVSANLVRPVIGWSGIDGGVVIDSCLRIAKANEVRGGALVFTRLSLPAFELTAQPLLGR